MCYRLREIVPNECQKTSRIGDRSQPQTYLIAYPQVMLETSG